MSAATSITVRVPLTIRRRPGRKIVVTPEGAPGVAAVCTRADPAMVKALARAFRWKRLLEDGRYASISDIAVAEKIDRGYVGTILRLTLLAPDVVEAILNGPLPDGIGLPALLEPFPIEWDQQRANGFVAAERRRANTDSATSNEITSLASPLSDQYREKRRSTRCITTTVADNAAR